VAAAVDFMLSFADQSFQLLNVFVMGFPLLIAGFPSMLSSFQKNKGSGVDSRAFWGILRLSSVPC